MRTSIVFLMGLLLGTAISTAPHRSGRPGRAAPRNEWSKSHCYERREFR